MDADFSAYDLGDPDAYCRFLLAHGRALPAAERVLARTLDLPVWRPRTQLLTNDLDQLHRSMPEPLSFDGGTDPAASWGVLYVVEGSRLGGSILARRVAADLPATYLNAIHRSGEWRSVCRALDAEAARHDDDWLERAVTGANACFELFERAATANGSVAYAGRSVVETGTMVSTV